MLDLFAFLIRRPEQAKNIHESVLGIDDWKWLLRKFSNFKSSELQKFCIFHYSRIRGNMCILLDFVGESLKPIFHHSFCRFGADNAMNFAFRTFQIIVSILKILNSYKKVAKSSNRTPNVPHFN